MEHIRITTPNTRYYLGESGSVITLYTNWCRTETLLSLLTSSVRVRLLAAYYPNSIYSEHIIGVRASKAAEKFMQWQPVDTLRQFISERALEISDIEVEMPGSIVVENYYAGEVIITIPKKRNPDHERLVASFLRKMHIPERVYGMMQEHKNFIVVLDDNFKFVKIDPTPFKIYIEQEFHEKFPSANQPDEIK